MKLLITLNNTSSILTSLQQHLPFTVLKLRRNFFNEAAWLHTVATAPTVYGIETTQYPIYTAIPIHIVATAPTVYGIETKTGSLPVKNMSGVATAPTVYGIETARKSTCLCFASSVVATAPTVYGIETE